MWLMHSLKTLPAEMHHINTKAYYFLYNKQGK